MSEHEQLSERDREQVEERHEHGAEHYRKVYLTLMALLVVSVAGPFLGIVWVTLITAFGIALVKANLVIQTRDDERIKTAIRDGGAAVGVSPLMAPWGVLYDDAQLDALVEYVKSFRPAGQ